MKKYLGLVCLLISLIMISSSLFVTSISAYDIDTVNNGYITVARFDNPEKLHSKAASSDIISDFEIEFSLDGSNLQIAGNIEDTAFNAIGSLITKDTLNNNLFYTAVETLNVYNTLHMSISKDIEEISFMSNLVANVDE